MVNFNLFIFIFIISFIVIIYFLLNNQTPSKPAPLVPRPSRPDSSGKSVPKRDFPIPLPSKPSSSSSSSKPSSSSSSSKPSSSDPSSSKPSSSDPSSKPSSSKPSSSDSSSSKPSSSEPSSSDPSSSEPSSSNESLSKLMPLLPKCELIISTVNVCAGLSTTIPYSIGDLPINTKCIDFTGMYPGVPSEFLNDTTYRYPNKGEYLIYNSYDNIPYFVDNIQGGLGDCILDSIFALLAYKQPDVILNSIVKDEFNENVYYIKINMSNEKILIRLTSELPVNAVLYKTNKYDEDYYDGAFDFYYRDEGTRKPIIWSHLLLKMVASLIGYYSVRDSGVNAYVEDENGIDVFRLGYDRLSWGFSTNESASIFYWLTGIDCKLFNVDTFNYNLLNTNEYLCLAGVNMSLVKNLVYDDVFGAYKWINGGWIQIEGLYVVIYNFDGTVSSTLIDFHAYSLFGYNGEEVIVRNPWGTFCIVEDYEYPDGIVYIPVDEFKILFNGMGGILTTVFE